MSDIKKLIKNFSSSAIGNILGQAIGFFTLLYLPRVLGANGYGVFNFAQSYAMYFLLFCDLGLSLYCVREINQNENKKDIINKVFNLKFYLSIISTIIFILSLLILKVEFSEKIILFCMSISVFFTGITIDYLFNAYSNMKYVGISVAIKI